MGTAQPAAWEQPPRPARRRGVVRPWLVAAWLLLSPAGAGAAVRPADQASPPTAQAAAGSLQQLIDNVPVLATGRTAVGGSDDLGQQLGALDPIADPQNGYLGVYHSPYRSRFGQTFRVSLAHSDDLLHWRILRVLDPYGASMPTLEPISGSDGYLLAYEKAVPGGDVIRIGYYASRDDLVNGVPSAQRNLPRVLSPYNDGTPTILGVDWQGSPAKSLIAIGFHYETSVRYRPAGDREAVGLLGGFRTWQAYRDVQADRALTAGGLRGSHGDWRRFRFEGFAWRAYEAETGYGSFANWRLALYDPASHQAYRLALRVGDARLSSVGNPIIRLLPAPGGAGQVLVVTAFVFDAADPSLTGELIYDQPLPATSAPPGPLQERLRPSRGPRAARYSGPA